MANDYYTPSGNPETLNRGSSAIIRAEFNALQNSFDLLPSLEQAFGGSANYAVDSGVVNAYVITVNAGIISLTQDGLAFRFKTANANTSSATLNTISIVRQNGDPLEAGDIVVGMNDVVYNTTTSKFHLMSTSLLSVANDAAASAAAAAASASAASGFANNASTSASSAAFSAVSAANSPSTNATSTTSLSIGVGVKSFTIEVGKAFSLGQTVIIARTSDPATQMSGTITAYNSGTGAIQVTSTYTNGSGTYTDWTISLSGIRGVQGSPGATLVRVNRSSNTMLVATDISKYFICTGTFTQTFDTPANLGNGWFCYIKNAGTSSIFVSTYAMYSNEERRFDCDGTTIRSIVISPFLFTSIASADFYKPPGYSAFEGLLWGGGASGAAARSLSATVNGGGAAACTPISYLTADMPSTVTFTIGAGGTAVTATSGGTIAGNDGGNSTFGVFTGYGGVAGGLSNVAVSGAGIYAKARSSGSWGGYPDGNSYIMAPSTDLANWSNGATYGGGGGGQVTTSTAPYPTKGGDTVYGGAGAAGCSGNGAGNYTTAGLPGNSYYGGTAGAGAYLNTGTTYVSTTVGTSIRGGSGGAVSVGSGSRTGATGGVRGGGGGAALSTDNVGATSGAGGRGELQLWGIL